MAYLNVIEIESAIEALSITYPGLVQRITLPHPTHEGRISHALRIGKSAPSINDGVLVLGGVHAREWVPSDALISLAADILEAYTSGTGLGYGGASFSHIQVRQIVESIDLFLFPCVNPDGRHHSQTSDPNWRKNRRPGAGGSSCHGVDLNRNFDFLWDHTTKFAGDSGVNSSADPCHPNLYTGPSAASEPETKNVVWLLESFPSIRFHIDIHSAVPAIFFTWGSDENQTTDASQNFLNPAFDSVRGRSGDVAYREFLPIDDLTVVSTLANSMNDAVRSVRNTDYGVEQSFSLYPTSGASDDYAYSRFFSDPSKTKVYGFTVECGTSFQPTWTEAENVIREVSAGIIVFSLSAPCVATPRSVNLASRSVVFNDIPQDETTARAIRFDVEGCGGVTLQVIAGPTIITGRPDSFSLILGNSVTLATATNPSSRVARLWLTYRGGAPDSTATGTIRVRCVETAEEWDIPISANAVERPKTAVMMVLDQSGSMEWDAGDGRTRVEVLREAALNFVDVLQSENGIGVVRFDHDAYLGMSVAEAGPEIFGPGRATALSQINSHTPNPEGATSIGDGIEMAASQLDTVTGYDHTAMIVLTDGQENTTKLIADVAGSVDDRTFAIGLGKPEDINPNALNDITNGTGGYVVMTGALSTDEYFILSKYYMQILAGVTNQEIVLDPQGYLQPGETQKVSFSLNEADSAADVIVLSPAPWALKMVLETPTGEILSPAALPMGIRFISTSGVAYFRFNLPVVTTGGRPAWAGKWVLHLECDKVSFRKYLSGLQNNPKLYEYTKGHGLRWSAIIEARSSLKFNASLHQKEILPGSSIHLAASLAEYGLPVENRAVVSAEMLTPDGALQTIELKETSPGHFASEVIAKEYGIYKFRMMAAGKTIRGNKFTREKTLTGSVYVLRPPVDPKPPVKDDDNCPKRIAVLLEIISKNPRLAAMLSSDLKK
jgi:murein tripeptide amidase MpaA